MGSYLGSWHTAHCTVKPINAVPNAVTRSMTLRAIGVGEAHQVEPIPGHVLAVLRFGQQPIDESLVGVERVVGQERLNLVAGRWQAGQIEAKAPDQRSVAQQ